MTTWWKCFHSSIRRDFSWSTSRIWLRYTRSCSFYQIWVKVRTVGWPQSWSDEVWCFMSKQMHCFTCSVRGTPDCLTAVCDAILETEIFVVNIWIRYDTIGEFNVDWKAEYSALSSTRSQKKKLKQPTPVPL